MEQFADSVIVCRCENVTLGDIKQAVAEGAVCFDDVKRRVRAGMGSCQGRMCAALVTRIIQELGGGAKPPAGRSMRMPVRPLPYGVLAGAAEQQLAEFEGKTLLTTKLLPAEKRREKDE